MTTARTSPPRLHRLLLAVAAAALVVVGLSACKPPDGARVLIYGDSLTIESKGSGGASFWLGDYQLDWTGTKYMTAPCNGIAISRTIGYVPDVVIINYAGNAGSFQDNCMAGETGQALAHRYEADVQTLIDRYRNGQTRIVVVGAPARKRTLADGNLVFDTLRDVAEDPANQVAFFDGGRNITPGRTTYRAATCLPQVETGSNCGTSADPRKNYIRDLEHEHFCPTGGTLNGVCASYNSGAVRLTLNFFDAVTASKVAVP